MLRQICVHTKWFGALWSFKNKLVCVDMAIFYLKNRKCDENKLSKFKSELLLFNTATVQLSYCVNYCANRLVSFPCPDWFVSIQMKQMQLGVKRDNRKPLF